MCLCFGYYLSPDVKLRESRIHGKGLVAIKKIYKGEVVLDFANGPFQFISTEEAKRLYRDGLNYMLQVDDDLYLATVRREDIVDGDFLNHSCDPNCGIRFTLRIVAMRDIESGEEITFDYAMSESEYGFFEMRCNCGSKRCRKVITGNDWRQKDLQRRYRGFFSEYLQKRIDTLRASVVS